MKGSTSADNSPIRRSALTRRGRGLVETRILPPRPRRARLDPPPRGRPRPRRPRWTGGALPAALRRGRPLLCWGRASEPLSSNSSDESSSPCSASECTWRRRRRLTPAVLAAAVSSSLVSELSSEAPPSPVPGGAPHSCRRPLARVALRGGERPARRPPPRPPRAADGSNEGMSTAPALALLSVTAESIRLRCRFEPVRGASPSEEGGSPRAPRTPP